MTTKTAALGDFLTDAEIQQVAKLYEKFRYDSTRFVSTVEADIIRPNMDRINKSLGQENDSKYLAYAVLHVFQTTMMDREMN